MNTGVIAIAALGMLSVMVFFFGIARFVAGSSEDITSRLDRYGLRGGGREAAAARGEHSRGKISQGLDRELAKRGKGADLSQELARADLKLTPGEFLMINVVSVVMAFLIGLLTFKVIYVALPFSILGYFAPRWIVKFRQARRQASFAAQLPDGISLLVNSLRSGYSLAQSMELLSREGQPPISEEFGRVVREIGLGLSTDQALNNMVRRIRNDDLDLMVTAIMVHHEVGGNLAQILEIIGHTIRERIRIKGEIRVLTAQQQISGYLVGSMPFGLTMVLFILNPEYMGELFGSLCGQMLACTAFAFVGTAFILIRKIVSIEV